MPSEIVLISGKELKDLVLSNPDHSIYFNGYKYFFTNENLERLEDHKLYYLKQKYGLLFITTTSGKTVLVKKGVSLRPKK